MTDSGVDPDAVLVDAARQAPEGDARAFEELVRRHQQHVMTNCRYMTRAADDAEDLAQEVFVKAFFGIGGFEGRSSFKSWLQRIKVNHCLNYLKKREGKVFVDVDDPAVAADPALAVRPRAERMAASRDDRQQIGDVLDRMSDTLRVPLVMRDLDMLAYQEIADALGIGLSATKMRIKRAREEFRRLYEEDATAAAPCGGAGESEADR